MDLSQLPHEVCAFRNQRTLWLSREILVQLGMEYLKLLYLLCHCTLVLEKCEQLALELLVQLALSPLHEKLELLGLLFLGLGHALDGALCLADVLAQLLQPLEQAARLVLDLLDVPLVDDLEALELMRLVLLAEHGAVATDCLLASVAEIVELRVVQLAELLLRAEDSVIL